MPRRSRSSSDNSKSNVQLEETSRWDTVTPMPFVEAFDGFMNLSYWEEVLGATGTFELIPAWKDYAGYAEEPDYEDKDNGNGKTN
jgi:hypothetical protein